MSKYNLDNKGDYESVKTGAEMFYTSLKEVYCPYFKEKIVFNTKGWEHLQFKNRGRSRSSGDQYVRFKLLYFVPEIISNSRTLQGIYQTNSFEMMNINSRWDKVLKPVTFWEFIAVISDIRARVVIKQIESGSKYFFSVIPYWKIKSGTNERLLFGHPPSRD